MSSSKRKGRSLSKKSVTSKGKIHKKDPKTLITNKNENLGQEEEEHKLQNSKIINLPIEENLNIPLVNKRINPKEK